MDSSETNSTPVQNPSSRSQSQSSTTSTLLPPFQQTVAYLDYYMDGTGQPVVRIFGSATTGQKSLMHLHGCYPYLYCDIPPGITEEDFVFDMQHRLDAVLKSNRQGNKSKVYRASIEKNKTPIYGFAEARNVCKIELFDPTDVHRVNDQLTSESFRVYHANVGYLLQVMVDLDLAGMDDITCSNYCFRGPLPDPEPNEDANVFRWTSSLALPSACVAIEPPPHHDFVQWWEHAPRPAKTSVCELEVDVNVADVMTNKPEITPGSLASKKIKFVKSLAVWWMAEEERRKGKGVSSDIERKEMEEEENHVDTGSSFVEDPYNFRGVVADIAQKCSEAAQSSSAGSSQVEFRRTKTPYEKGGKFKSSPDTSSYSQDTMDLINIMESWVRMNEEEKGEPDGEIFEESSPSQLSDDDLLRSSQPSDTSAARIFATPPPRAAKKVSFAIEKTVIEDDAAGNEIVEDEEDDDAESQHVWQDILTSQKDFVERMDDGLDGGTFDGSDDDDISKTNASKPVDVEDDVVQIPSPPSSPSDQFESKMRVPTPPTPMSDNAHGFVDPVESLLSLDGRSNLLPNDDDEKNKSEQSAAQPEKPKRLRRSLPATQETVDMRVKIDHVDMEEPPLREEHQVHRSVERSNTQRDKLLRIEIDDNILGRSVNFAEHPFNLPSEQIKESLASESLKLRSPSNDDREEAFVEPQDDAISPMKAAHIAPSERHESKKTSFRGLARLAPMPNAVPTNLNRVEGRALHYSDHRDVPKRTADEFRNAHLATPTALLETVSPCFADESKLFPSNCQKKRTKWLEPKTAAPIPTAFAKGQRNSSREVTSKSPSKAVVKVPIALSREPDKKSKPVTQQLQPSESTSSKDSAKPSSAPPSQQSDASKPTPSSALKFTPMRQTSQLSQVSSLSHATPGNPVTQNQKKGSMRTALEKNPANNQLTLLGFEILAKSRSTAAGREGKGKPFALLPDPEHDPVLAIFYCVRDDYRDEASGMGRGATDAFGALYVRHKDEASSWRTLAHDYPNASTKECEGEKELLDAFVELVRKVDPDVLMGWEVQKESLGYLLVRAKVLGDISFARRLSRVPFGHQDRRHENDSWGDAEHSGFWLAGRHIFNLWRVCREELKLYTYTVHNVLLQLTGERLPKYSPAILCQWWDLPLSRALVCNHFHARTKSLLRICDHLDILGRNSELARLFGMDLFSVMTRGSQFRVEAVLLRVCKGLNYLMLSPTPKQVAAQPAMEATPLIFEPESAFYSSPVLVLDFRSLYPSVIIANNMCFSTCLGRLKQNNPDKDDADPFMPGLGCDPGYAPPLPLLTQKDDFGFVSPNGICFVSKKKREGLLPRMLREILDARVMIKKSVEGPDVEESKKRVADARQFGLKMIANVTYGYTAASFSGRMPCAEIADAIVQTGRACLERAIKIVLDKNASWAPAECVYGDTDSLFVHLPGRDLEEARRIGHAITEAVSQALPNPMKLQFEKVFFPCVLEVKKRYVGWKFSSTKPANGVDKGTLDAKGIETIRRDGCPAVVKTMELVLKELFTSMDLSKVKAALKKQLDKMFAGTVTLSDFILSGKVKLGSYAKDRKNTGNYPPAAVVADKMLRRDPRAKPVYKERVCYVVACGPPGARLIDLVVDPHELLTKNLRVNVAHYVYKLVLPALDRLLICAAVDVKSWFSFDKTKNLWGGWRRRLKASSAAGTAMIHRFFEAVPCVLCGKPSASLNNGLHLSLCGDCSQDMQRARMTADVVSREAELRARRALTTCAACVRKQGSAICGQKLILISAGDVCLNLDCEDFFARKRAMDRVVFDVEGFSTVGPALDDVEFVD